MEGTAIGRVCPSVCFPSIFWTNFEYDVLHVHGSQWSLTEDWRPWLTLVRVSKVAFMVKQSDWPGSSIEGILFPSSGYVYHMATILLVQQQQSFNGLFSRTTWVNWYQKDKPFWIFWSRDDEVAETSAGPYASHLHLAPSKQIITPTPHHLFFMAGCSSCRQPTASKHWSFYSQKLLNTDCY